MTAHRYAIVEIFQRIPVCGRVPCAHVYSAAVPAGDDPNVLGLLSQKSVDLARAEFYRRSNAIRARAVAPELGRRGRENALPTLP